MYCTYRGRKNMKRKEASIFICTLMVFAAVVPLAGTGSVMGNVDRHASVHQGGLGTGSRDGGGSCNGVTPMVVWGTLN